jgi:hypothetical protein
LNQGKLSVSPSGNFLYLEFSGTALSGFTVDNVYAFSIDASSGAVTNVTGSPLSIGTSVAGYDSWFGAVLAPDGKFLYAPGRYSGAGIVGYDTIILVYPVNPVDGTIGALPVSSITGTFGGLLLIDPSGDVLALVGGDLNNEDSTWTFAINGSTGSLATVAGSPFSIEPESTTLVDSSAIVKIP